MNRRNESGSALGESTPIEEITRREIGRRLVGLVLAAPFVAWASGSVRTAWAAEGAAAKVTKETAQYQETPNDSQRCADCLQFVAPDACNVVRGDVVPDGWCKLFVAKEPTQG